MEKLSSFKWKLFCLYIFYAIIIFVIGTLVLYFYFEGSILEYKLIVKLVLVAATLFIGLLLLETIIEKIKKDFIINMTATEEENKKRYPLLASTATYWVSGLILNLILLVFSLFTKTDGLQLLFIISLSLYLPTIFRLLIPSIYKQVIKTEYIEYSNQIYARAVNELAYTKLYTVFETEYNFLHFVLLIQFAIIAFGSLIISTEALHTVAIVIVVSSVLFVVLIIILKRKTQKTIGSKLKLESKPIYIISALLAALYFEEIVALVIIILEINDVTSEQTFVKYIICIVVVVVLILFWGIIIYSLYNQYRKINEASSKSQKEVTNKGNEGRIYLNEEIKQDKIGKIGKVCDINYEYFEYLKKLRRYKIIEIDASKKEFSMADYTLSIYKYEHKFRRTCIANLQMILKNKRARNATMVIELLIISFVFSNSGSDLNALFSEGVSSSKSIGIYMLLGAALFGTIVSIIFLEKVISYKYKEDYIEVYDEWLLNNLDDNVIICIKVLGTTDNQEVSNFAKKINKKILLYTEVSNAED